MATANYHSSSAHRQTQKASHSAELLEPSRNTTTKFKLRKRVNREKRHSSTTSPGTSCAPERKQKWQGGAYELAAAPVNWLNMVVKAKKAVTREYTFTLDI